MKFNRRNSNGKGLAARFLFECAMKLEMKPLTSATGAILFHRFFSEVDPADYDEYVSQLTSIRLEFASNSP